MSTDTPVTSSLKPWYRVQQSEDHLTFHYADSVVSVKGRAASTILPALLPLLDGRHTVQEIQEAVGEELGALVAPAIGLLDREGLLIDGSIPQADTAQARTVVFLASIGGAGSPSDVEERIVCTVAVLGSSNLAAEIYRTFQASGLACARAGAPQSFGDERYDLVVVAPSPQEEPALRVINDRARSLRQPWMQVLPYDGRAAVVGPLFIPYESACYECYRLRRASNVNYPEEYLTLDGACSRFGPCAAIDVTLAGLAVTSALRWLGAQDPSLVGTMMTFHPLGERPVSTHHVLRVPRCGSCSRVAHTPPPSPWFED